jgi:hypothetical protein
MENDENRQLTRPVVKRPINGGFGTMSYATWTQARCCHD